MQSMALNVVLLLFAYLSGSIPTGLILSRVFASIDIREHGSHNIGATNVYRNLGKKLGLLTLLGDVVKGFLPVYLIYFFSGSETLAALGALAGFLGHLYSIFLNFSGGKGVATALGTFLVLSPYLLLIAFVIFAIILTASRYVSLGSIVSALAMPALMVLSPHPYPPVTVLVAAVIAVLIVYKHKENITRIRAGNESKLGRA